MRNYIFAAFFAITLFALSNCFGPVYETRYTYDPPVTTEGRMCVNQCQQMSTICKQNCKLNLQQCETNALLQAQIEYQNYVNRRNLAGKSIKRTIESFRRPCYDNGCSNECDQNFRFCFMNCGGQIREHTICTAFCE